MKRIVKFCGVGLASTVLLAAAVAMLLSYDATRRLSKTYEVTVERVAVPTDEAAVARGRRWGQILCSGCHGDDFGGFAMFSDPTLGSFAGPNLTRGAGGLGAMSERDWIRALRHGVGRNRRPLFVMPARHLRNLSDSDLGDLIAFMKTAPTVSRSLPARDLALVGRILVSLGAFGDVINAETIDHSSPPPPAPPRGVTAAYGRYLVSVFGCSACHGENLAGGKDANPDAPPAPNLTRAGAAGYTTRDQFVINVRNRRSQFMPWKNLAYMTDDELHAVWTYVLSLPATPSPPP